MHPNLPRLLIEAGNLERLIQDCEAQRSSLNRDGTDKRGVQSASKAKKRKVRGLRETDPWGRATFWPSDGEAIRCYQTVAHHKTPSRFEKQIACLIVFRGLPKTLSLKQRKLVSALNLTFDSCLGLVPGFRFGIERTSEKRILGSQLPVLQPGGPNT